MSGGEFEEIKAPKGGDHAAQEGAHEDKHNALDEFRFAPKPDTAAKEADNKVEGAKKGADDTKDTNSDAVKAKYDKGYKEGSGEAYSDYLARTRTPEQNQAAIEAALKSITAKIAELSKSGFETAKADVTAGGSFLAGVVRDGSSGDFQKLMAKLNSQIKD